MSFIKIGPAGKEVGVAWDEKGNTKIVQIFISHGNAGIESIQFQYAVIGTRVLSARHGATLPSNFDVVKLSCECITWISGETGQVTKELQCITFGTNHRTYGPFGKSSELGDKFIFRLGESQFGGFFGTADSQKVNSIGVYLKPALHD